jgi:hypothetical protein
MPLTAGCCSYAKLKLNLQMVEDKYTLPNMADLAACLYGWRIFSKLDLLIWYL